MIADNSFKGRKWMKAELSQAKLQNMKGKKIPRVVFLQAVPDCLQMNPDNKNSFKGIGKIGYNDSCKIKYLQIFPFQSHIGNYWNDNHGSLIAILQIVWYYSIQDSIAFRKVHQHEKHMWERKIYCAEMHSAVMAESYDLLLLSCKLEQIWSCLTLYIFSSAGKNSRDSILKNEKLQVQSENKDCQFLLAEGMVDIQEKKYLRE